jgi:octaprenyl-diphosphate synthase
MNGGIEYAHSKMMTLKTQALELLNDVPDSEAKRSIMGLVEYTTLREK